MCVIMALFLIEVFISIVHELHKDEYPMRIYEYKYEHNHKYCLSIVAIK